MLADYLRKSVLQQAVMGKLVPQDDNDEPASMIIKKINEKKEKLISENKIKKENKLVTIKEEEIPFDIPDSWKWVKLPQITLKITDGTHNSPPNTQSGDYMYITAKNIKDNGIDTNNITFVSKEIHETIYSRCNPEYGDILYIKDGATTGVATINQLKEPFSLLSSVALIKTCIVNNLYIVYAMRSPIFYGVVRELMKGTGITRITLTTINNLLIPLPPLEEQKRIVKKLEEVMRKIDEFEVIEKELLKLNNGLPMDLRNSILQYAMQGKLIDEDIYDTPVDLLINKIYIEKEQLIKEKKIKKERKLLQINDEEIPFEIPDNWAWERLGNCAVMYTGNSISQIVKKNKYTGLSEGYNYIGTKDIGFDNKIDYENGIKIPFNEPKFKYAYSGDILLCIEGGSAGRKIAITDETVCFGNKLCKFHALQINNRFLYYYLQSNCFTSIFKNNITGIIGGVSITKLKNLLIPLPPIEEQERIVKKLDKILPLCEKINKY